MSRQFKTVDYEATLDTSVRLGDCLPPDHFAPDHDTIAAVLHSDTACNCRRSIRELAGVDGEVVAIACRNRAGVGDGADVVCAVVARCRRVASGVSVCVV